MKLRALLLSLVIFGAAPAAGAELELQQVTDKVYAIVGDLGNRSPQNLGNNATFGLVLTSEGVVLIDPGGTYRGAQQIDALIDTLTDAPVVRVINTGGQDHRWLGNGFFRERGASIIASSRAVEDQRARLQDEFIRLDNLVGKAGLEGTEAVYADQRFEQDFVFDLGGTRFELYFAGQAHTPGDIFVWLPQQRVMFTGDIVYTERMLGVGTQSHSGSWIKTFEAMAAYQPEHVVPGHGRATDLARARRDTYDYLVFLRESVTAFMDEGGDLSEIGSIDQSAWEYLRNHDTLAGRNAQQVFTELEWE